MTTDELPTPTRSIGPREVGPHLRVWDIWNWSYDHCLYSMCSDCTARWLEGDEYPTTCVPVDG